MIPEQQRRKIQEKGLVDNQGQTFYSQEYNHQRQQHYQSNLHSHHGFSSAKLEDSENIKPLRRRSYCSTCSSHSSSADYEQDDIEVTWPWIEHIKDNGDLFYIESLEPESDVSFRSLLNQHKQNQQIHNGSMSRNIQDKIKTVIKKSRSFGKKDSNNIKNESNKSLLEIKKELEKRNKTKKSHNHHLDVLTNNDTLTKKSKPGFLCENLLLKLEKPCNENFISLENIFGIITGLDLDPVLDSFDDDILHGNDLKKGNAIIVQGLLPSGPAALCGNIKIGDYLVAVNGVPVNLLNIDTILKESRNYIQFILTIERLNPDALLDENKFTSVIVNNLSTNDQFAASKHTCALANLSMNGTEDDPESDIVFWYPDNENNKMLKVIRGIFLTLSDVLKEITGRKVKSTDLLINGMQVNVCYHKYNSNVLILAIPSERCCLTKLEKYLQELLIFLQVSFETIENAFNEANISLTRHLVLMFMEMVLQYDNPLQLLGTVPFLSLSNQHYIDINNILSDSEAADYADCIDDFFPHRRLYCTLGTCLFYKGALVCSHLGDDILKEILIFCKYHWLFLLTQSERLKQLVIWKEFHVTSSDELKESNSEFIKPSGLRWFLLIVGQGNSLLCTLFEAGGAASIPDGNPGPHPYYVDTACSILSYLIESYQLEKICQAKLDGPSSPATVKAIEAIYPRTSKSPRALMLSQRKCVGNYGQSSIDSTSHQPIPETFTSFERHNSLDSSTSSSSHGFTRNDISSSSIQSVNSNNATPDISLSMTLSTKLTTGYYNSLFHFLIFQKHRGTFICPNDTQCDSSDLLTTNIMNCFKHACEQIHDMFTQNQHDQVQLLEHGVLFHAEQTHGAEMKVNAPNVSYWVVGRLVRYGLAEEEIYVCFQDGVPQNIIEMAFKLRHGCYY